MVLDTTQQLGWAYDTQATPWADPIDAVDALYWKWGVRTHDFKDFHPSEFHDWAPIYTGQYRNPADSQLARSHNSGGFAYYPTNGVIPFLALGGSSVAANVHTVTNINSGSLPTFTVRSEMSGGSSDRFLATIGCKVASVSGMINFMGEFNVLSETVTYNGLNTLANNNTSLNQVHTTGTKHPTSDYTVTGTERDARYKHTASSAFSWDSDAMINDLGMLNYTIVNHQTIGNVENAANTAYIDEGNYQFLFSFALWRGNANPENVFTDYMNNAQKDMVFTIYNDVTNSYYRTYTWTNASLKEFKAIYAEGDEKKLWQANGYAEGLSIAVKDGVSDTFYED